MEQVRSRVTDKRVLGLIRLFLAAGVMRELDSVTATPSGTPQGSLCSAEHKPPYAQHRVMRSES
jgi:RNA-directed DNA polymerase